MNNPEVTMHDPLPSTGLDVHLRLLLGTGALSATQTEAALRLFDDVRAMTWRLLHPST